MWHAPSDFWWGRPAETYPDFHPLTPSSPQFPSLLLPLHPSHLQPDEKETLNWNPCTVKNSLPLFIFLISCSCSLYLEINFSRECSTFTFKADGYFLFSVSSSILLHPTYFVKVVIVWCLVTHICLHMKILLCRLDCVSLLSGFTVSHTI